MPEFIDIHGRLHDEIKNSAQKADSSGAHLSMDQQDVQIICQNLMSFLEENSLTKLIVSNAKVASEAETVYLMTISKDTIDVVLAEDEGQKKLKFDPATQQFIKAAGCQQMPLVKWVSFLQTVGKDLKANATQLWETAG